jgi:hypothetical protein
MATIRPRIVMTMIISMNVKADRCPPPLRNFIITTKGGSQQSACHGFEGICCIGETDEAHLPHPKPGRALIPPRKRAEAEILWFL